MALEILNKQALGNITDLTTPTSTAQYPIGFVVSLMDSATGYMKQFMYVKNRNATLAAKATATIALSGTSGAELVTAVPATSTVPLIAGVANVSVTANYYFFLQIYGDTTIATAGATTAGNTGKLANGVATITDEAGTGETAKTLGVIKTTLSGAGDATVFLINKRVAI